MSLRRVAEGDDVVAVADAGRLGRPVAVLGVEQRVALRLRRDLRERVEDVLDPVAVPVVAPAVLVLRDVGPVDVHLDDDTAAGR